MNTSPITSTTTAPVNPYAHRQETVDASIIAKIGDVIRGSLLSEKLEGIPLLLRSVTEQVTNRGGRYYIKNFWNDPTPLSLGYVGIHVKIRLPIPPKKHRYILMEVQIHAKQIMDGTGGCAKEIAHRLYKMPGETEESLSPDLISSSQLVYLTSMIKLLHSREELRRVANTVDSIQKMTKLDEKKRLVLETALLLNNKEGLGHGEWNEELQAIVPRNREAVAKAWIETAEKINKLLHLPTCEMDKDYAWVNTATSIDKLYDDAEQIASDFETICAVAAGHPWCSFSFGPGNKHMIKEKKSLQDKIHKDKKALSGPTQQPKVFAGHQPLVQPTTSLSPKDAYLELLLPLLENPSIKSDLSLVEILESEAQELVDQEAKGLTAKQNKSYQLVQKLFVDQKVSQFIAKNLRKLHAPDESKRPPVVTHLPTSFTPSVNPNSSLDSPSEVNKVLLPALSSQPPSAPPEAFGEEKWTTLCGRVAPAPPLPPGFSAIWNGPCPIYPDKKVSDTHMLVYLPATVDGRPLTLNSLGAIAKRYFPRTKQGYEDDRPITKACWVLMTKDILPRSRGKSYTVQATMVSALATKALAPYEVPQRLEAAVCILTHYFSSGTFLFPIDPSTYTNCQVAPSTYTHCQENILGFQIVVGGFAHSGLDVSGDHCVYDLGDIGVAVLRKF